MIVLLVLGRCYSWYVCKIPSYLVMDRTSFVIHLKGT